MHNPSEDFIRDIQADTQTLLSDAASDEYARPIMEHIYRDVADDVLECSAYKEEGEYNIDDVKLAIGRILMDKLGITDSNF